MASSSSLPKVPWSELVTETSCLLLNTPTCRSTCNSPTNFIVSDYDDSDTDELGSSSDEFVNIPPPLPPLRRTGESPCPTSSPCRYSLAAEYAERLSLTGQYNNHSKESTFNEEEEEEREDVTVNKPNGEDVNFEISLKEERAGGIEETDGVVNSNTVPAFTQIQVTPAVNNTKKKTSASSPYFTLMSSSFNLVTSIHGTLPRRQPSHVTNGGERERGKTELLPTANGSSPIIKEKRAATSTRPYYDVNKLQHRRAGSDGKVVEDNLGTELNGVNSYEWSERRPSISCLDLAKPTKLEQDKKMSTMPSLSKTSLTTAGIVATAIGKAKKLPNLHKAKTAKALSKMLSHPDVDPNMRNKHHDTPLHTFVRKAKTVKNVERLVTLLSSDKNVSIDEYDGDYNTALHIAVKNDDMHTVAILVAFGANTNISNPHKQEPIDLAPPNGLLREFLNQFVSKPKFTAIENRHRGYTLRTPGLHCTPDMLGYYLNWRREARLCLDMENEIYRMLQEEIVNNISEAASAFMQLNHLHKWRQTRGRLTVPGSRVLVLDGGGIRGLTTIEILMEIESRTEKRIVELFDWIIGTSTGAIVALGLVYAKMTLSQIRDLYIRMAPSVFGGSFLQSDQNSANLEKILIEVFGQNTLMTSITEPRVMVSAVNISESSLEVQFFNNFNENKELTEVPVWMVARATSAAPMYFSPFNGFIDGGVKANNPCDYAINEIRRYYDTQELTPPHFPIIVSVGTCHFPAQKLNDFNTTFKKNIKDVISTPKHLFDLLIYAISDSEEVARNFSSQCKAMNTPFFRFNPFMKEEVKANETDPNTLLDLIIETKVFLMKGEVLADLYEMVQVFHQLEDLDDSVTDFL